MKFLVMLSLVALPQLSFAEPHPRHWATWSCSNADNQSFAMVFSEDGSKAAVTGSNGGDADEFIYNKTESANDVFVDSTKNVLSVPSVTDGMSAFSATFKATAYSCF